MSSSDVVNEQSSASVTVNFYDENDDPAIPSSGTYKITDFVSGDVIVAETNIPFPSPITAIVNIPITYAQNAILAGQGDEIHILTVKFQYGAGKQGTDAYKFRLLDLEALA